MEKIELVKLLAKVLADDENAAAIADYLDENCKYDSDYADKHYKTAKDIIESMNSVADTIRNSDEDCSNNCEIVNLSTILNVGITLNKIHGDSFCDVFETGILMYQYHSDDPAAVVFVTFNNTGEIAGIQLSRNKEWFNKTFLGDIADSERDVPYTVKSISHCAEEIMISEKIESTWQEYEQLDDSEVYIWRQANEYFKDWLRVNKYRISEYKAFDDCIGYHCLRNEEWYTIYMYAIGSSKQMQIDGKTCASLKNREFSKGLVLVSPIQVARIMSGGKYKYYVGHRNDAHNPNLELWHPDNIEGKDVLLFYPRKEMFEIADKFSYAFNNESADAFDLIVTAKNPSFEKHDEGGIFLNDAFFTCLRNIRINHGEMKYGYVSFDGIVYSQISYVEGYGWFSFSVGANDKIDKVKSYAFNDEEVADFWYTEDLPQPVFENIPNPIKINVLPPIPSERFAVLIDFDNGETKKYVLHVPKENEKDEAIRFERKPLSDGIWKSAELVKTHEAKYRGFSDGGPAIKLKSGLCISALKCYEDGKTYPECPASQKMEKVKLFENDDVFIMDEHDKNIGCGHINNDGHLYFIDKTKREAIRLPEKYRDTPIILYHPCGGYQEGLIMVSLLGEVDLQYHHTFGDTAGMWGWIDLEGNEVIPPQYIYALSFDAGRAIVCKGEWSVNEKGEYWSDEENWGIIDTTGKEIVPCMFDEIFFIDETERYILCHKGGWKEGCNCIYDIEAGEVILEMDFDFDNGYMFNEVFFHDNCICFDEHEPGKEEDYIYIYSLSEKKWLQYHEKYENRELNGETKIVVNKDGHDIIVF